MHYSLNSHRVDNAAHLEAALFELHDRRVVYACALWENKDGRIVRVGDVRSETLCNGQSIFGLGTFEPNVRRGTGQRSLQDAQKTTVALTNLQTNSQYNFIYFA